MAIFKLGEMQVRKTEDKKIPKNWYPKIKNFIKMTSFLLDVQIKDFSVLLSRIPPPLKLGVQIKREHI